MLGDSVLFFRKSCMVGSGVYDGYNCTRIGPFGATWRSELDYSTVDHEVTYTISAWAQAASSASSAHEDALAVADPFLTIDPSWKYASYFVAQQESLEQPGTWLEVSRAWTQPVPEPATWITLAGGLLALGLARRSGRGRRR
jgi:hypothetical protein